MPPKDSSLKRMYTSWESGGVSPLDWQDELCEVFGLPPAALGFAEPEHFPQLAVLDPPQLLVPEYGDSTYLESVRKNTQNLISLNNRFGGGDLVRFAARFFSSVHDLLGVGAYDRRMERDLNAAAGELAEVVGWLAYDAEQHDLVRRMNQESLYFTRLAGDKSIELLTLQNASMHAGHVGRPGEALQLARSVLEGGFSLSPRLKALFLTRKARALAQMGDDSSLSTFQEVRSLFLEGVREDDPDWAWWIDERELAWHEAMAGRDLRKVDVAISEFEHSVEATAPTQTRSLYHHRAHLLQAQVDLRAWTDVEATARSIFPLISQVASIRTAILLRKTIAQVAGIQAAPDGVTASMAQLSVALETSPI
jgi:hypothetical protein